MGVDLDRLPPETKRGPPGKKRPFSRGFLLAAVTLGLYSFWWQYRTHDELTQFLDRPNRLQYAWGAHLVTFAALIAFTFLVIYPATVDYVHDHGVAPYTIAGDQPPGPEPIETAPIAPVESPIPPHNEPFSFFTFLKNEGLLIPFLFLLVVSQLFYAIHVVFQHRLLYRHTERFEGWGAAAFFFLSMVWGSWLLSRSNPESSGLTFLLFLITLGMLLIAYYSLQSTYNNFWESLVPQSAVSREQTSDRLPDGRRLVQSSVSCTGCERPISLAGAAGDQVQTSCPECGTDHTTRLPSGLSNDSSPSPIPGSPHE